METGVKKLRGEGVKSTTDKKTNGDTEMALSGQDIDLDLYLGSFSDEGFKTGSNDRTPAKRAPGRKRSGKKKKKKQQENFMDDLLASDGETEKVDRLRRSVCWIPDMEHRKHPTTKPDKVPSQLWMSYCMMEEFVYRQALTEEEVLSLPLIDDVFIYKQGGSRPLPPPGFHWDDNRNLVPSGGMEVSGM